MPKQVHKTVFVTRDGEEFASSTEAALHERLLDFQDHYENSDNALFGFDARRVPVEDVMDWLRENQVAVLALYGETGSVPKRSEV
ncbi:hypothetical protein [Litorivivens sp.]|uniref:hypothetical protein n=1 Tax=Litorivivens sp. TaxID=2020868 RepID=UPI003562A791